MTNEPQAIRPRDRDAILQSLRAGVVPRVGQQYIQVGRASELEALVTDVARIADGGSAIRFVIGEFGSGKTFFLMLVRAVALERRLVTLHADLTPDRRLQGSGGQARALYAELLSNISTRAKPDGGALASIVERFVTSAVDEAGARCVDAELVMLERFANLREMVGGYDFANVIRSYWQGYRDGNDSLRDNAVRWLRGEFSTKTEARAALDVRNIVDDATWYDHLKLLAQFVRMAGYSGLLVCLDELVNLYKLNNVSARQSNYEQLLRILNDSLQGGAAGMGWLVCGTPEFLFDPRRGVYSYAALQTRLAENSFASGGLVDYSGPVLRLANLSPEDLYVLLTKLRAVYDGGDPTRAVLPDEALEAFMSHCHERIGDAYFRTPRNTIKEFVNLMAVLDQNPGSTWQDLLGRVDLTAEANTDLVLLPTEDNDHVPTAWESPAGTAAQEISQGGDDDLRTFRL